MRELCQDANPLSSRGKLDKLSWTNPKDSEQLPVYQTVLKMHHLLHGYFALEKVGRTLQKIFAMPGVICPNIRYPTFMLLKSSVYFYCLFSHFLSVHCHILLPWVFLSSCCQFLVLFSQKKNKAVKQNPHFTQQTFLVHQLHMRCSRLLQKKRKQRQHNAAFFHGIKSKKLVSKVRVGGL